MNLIRKIIAEEYFYDSEEEGEFHKETMIKAGWEDCGKLKYDGNWYGKFIKEEIK